MIKNLLFLACFATIILTINSTGLKSGLYFIKSVKYNTFWDSYKAPDNVLTQKYHGDDYQKYYVTKLPNGLYTFTFQKNGRNLAAALSPNPKDTLFLTKYPNSNNVNQQFVVTARGNNHFMIKPKIDLSLAIEANDKKGKDIFLNDKDCYSDAQLFSFKKVEKKKKKGDIGLLGFTAEEEEIDVVERDETEEVELE